MLNTKSEIVSNRAWIEHKITISGDELELESFIEKIGKNPRTDPHGDTYFSILETFMPIPKEFYELSNLEMKTGRRNSEFRIDLTDRYGTDDVHEWRLWNWGSHVSDMIGIKGFVHQSRDQLFTTFGLFGQPVTKGLVTVFRSIPGLRFTVGDNSSGDWQFYVIDNTVDDFPISATDDNYLSLEESEKNCDFAICY